MSNGERNSVSLTWGVVLVCLGYGLFLGAIPTAPSDASPSSGLTLALAITFAFHIGIALGCLGLLALDRRQGVQIAPLPGAISYVTITLLCIFVGRALPAAATGPVIYVILALVMGCAASCVMAFYYERVLAICVARGRAACVATLVAAELVCLLGAYVMLGFLAGEVFPAIAFDTVVCVIGAAICQVLLSVGEKPAVPARDPATEGSEYHLTRHSVPMLACLGVAWGLVSSSLLCPFVEPLPAWSMALVGVLTLAAGIVLVRAITHGIIMFGGLVRLAIVVAGTVLVLSPVLLRLAPLAFFTICPVVFVFTEIALALFTIDICRENCLPVLRVMPKNYAVFIGAGSLAGALFGAFHIWMETQLAWELVAAVSAIAVFSIIPLLPSRSSDAVVFTLAELPENEGYEDYVLRRRAKLAIKYALTDREAETLELMLRGMTRNQIADELCLSPWTIKHRIAAIYEKCGVHSYKGLMGLVEDAG